MKKLLLILSLILIVGTLSAQNERANLMKLYGGVLIGRNGTGIGSTFVLNTHSLVHHIDSLTLNSTTSPTLFKIYHGSTQLNPDVPASFQVVAGTVQPMNADTTVIAFGIGSGAIADTACFNNNRLAGSFFNEGSDSLIVRRLRGVLVEGTGTETISVQISWHATFLSGSATSLNAAPLAITSLTTGTIDVSFANATIPPGVYVWCILSGASKDNKPTYLDLTLGVSRQNRKY